ncbi:MAG: hypothetical protein IH607_08755, partial [Firmicutes bacterium]|nr:hypothetical protein [Bacillota bacterium]
MNCHYIIGIKLDNRVANASVLQQTLTKNGCLIKTRLGLHEVDDDTCANYGLIILQPCGTPAEIDKLVKDLNALDGITAK